MPEVIMPRLSDTMEEGELSRWLKQVGDTVQKGDVLAEIETDKATMDLEAFENGVLEQQLVAAGTMVPIGQPVAVIGDGSGAKAAPAAPAAEPAAPAETAPEAPAAEAAAARGAGRGGTGPAGADGRSPAGAHAEADELRASPLARKIARDHGIDIAARSPAPGRGGRIVRADVEAAIAARARLARSPPRRRAAPVRCRTGHERGADQQHPQGHRAAAHREPGGTALLPHQRGRRRTPDRVPGRGQRRAGGIRRARSASTTSSCGPARSRCARIPRSTPPGAATSCCGTIGSTSASRWRCRTASSCPVVKDADRKSLGEIAAETANWPAGRAPAS